MKNTVLISVALLSMTFFSCSKSYDCSCVDEYGVETNKTGKGKNHDDACDNAENTVLGVSIEDCAPSS